jgi:signal transduction histidine kinase
MNRVAFVFIERGARHSGGGGFGLVNLQRRAEKLHGSFVIESSATGGSSLVWQVPII